MQICSLFMVTCFCLLAKSRLPITAAPLVSRVIQSSESICTDKTCTAERRDDVTAAERSYPRDYDEQGTLDNESHYTKSANTMESDAGSKAIVGGNLMIPPEHSYQTDYDEDEPFDTESHYSQSVNTMENNVGSKSIVIGHGLASPGHNYRSMSDYDDNELTDTELYYSMKANRLENHAEPKPIARSHFFNTLEHNHVREFDENDKYLDPKFFYKTKANILANCARVKAIIDDYYSYIVSSHAVLKERFEANPQIPLCFTLALIVFVVVTTLLVYIALMRFDGKTYNKTFDNGLLPLYSSQTYEL